MEVTYINNEKSSFYGYVRIMITEDAAKSGSFPTRGVKFLTFEVKGLN